MGADISVLLFIPTLDYFHAIIALQQLVAAVVIVL